MQRPCSLQIPTSIKLDDQSQKSPNISLSPSEADFFKGSTLDPNIVIDCATPTGKETTAYPTSPVTLSQLPSTQVTQPSEQFTGIRARFIRKVLCILFLQIVITVVSVSLTLFPSLGIGDFVRSNIIIVIVMGIVCLTSLLLLAFKREIYRKVPKNYIMLFIFTCSISYLLACISAFSRSEIILFAGFSTLFIIFGIMLYACKTRRRLTGSGMGIIVLVIVFALTLIVGLTFPDSAITALYSGVIAALFGLHLAYDIQRLIGRYENKYSFDDYIIASLDIYIDIVQIFVVMVDLLRRIMR